MNTQIHNELLTNQDS